MKAKNVLTVQNEFRIFRVFQADEKVNIYAQDAERKVKS